MITEDVQHWTQHHGFILQLFQKERDPVKLERPALFAVTVISFNHKLDVDPTQ